MVASFIQGVINAHAHTHTHTHTHTPTHTAISLIRNVNTTTQRREEQQQSNTREAADERPLWKWNIKVWFCAYVLILSHLST